MIHRSLIEYWTNNTPRYVDNWLVMVSCWVWINQKTVCIVIVNQCHDDVIKWKHFPRYWPFFVRGIHLSPVNHKSQWCGALVFSLICAWISGWVNNREAGDSRRHRVHYDVTVMSKQWSYRNIAQNHRSDVKSEKMHLRPSYYICDISHPCKSAHKQTDIGPMLPCVDVGSLLPAPMSQKHRFTFMMYNLGHYILWL